MELTQIEEFISANESKEIVDRRIPIEMKQGEPYRNAVRVLQIYEVHNKLIDLAHEYPQIIIPIALEYLLQKIANKVAEINFYEERISEATKLTDETTLDGVPANRFGLFSELFSEYCEHIGIPQDTIGKIRATLFAGVFTAISLDQIQEYYQNERPSKFWWNILKEGGHGLTGPKGVHSLEVYNQNPERAESKNEVVKRRVLGQSYLEFLQNQIIYNKEDTHSQFNLELLTSDKNALQRLQEKETDPEHLRLLDLRLQDLDNPEAIIYQPPSLSTPHTHNWGTHFDNQEIGTFKKEIQYSSANPILRVIDQPSASYYDTHLLDYLFSSPNYDKSNTIRIRDKKESFSQDELALFSIVDVDNKTRRKEAINEWTTRSEARENLRYKSVSNANKGLFGFAFEFQVDSKNRNLSTVVKASHVTGELQESHSLAMVVARIYENQKDFSGPPLTPYLKNTDYCYGVVTVPARDENKTFYKNFTVKETAESAAHYLIDASEVTIFLELKELLIPIKNSSGRTEYITPVKANKLISEKLSPTSTEKEDILNQVLARIKLKFNGQIINLETVDPNSPAGIMVAETKKEITKMIFPSALSVQPLVDAEASLDNSPLVCKNMVHLEDQAGPRLSFFPSGKISSLTQKILGEIKSRNLTDSTEILKFCDQKLKDNQELGSEIARRQLISKMANAAADPVSSLFSQMGSLTGSVESVLRIALEKLSLYDKTMRKNITNARSQTSWAGTLKYGIQNFISAGTGQFEITTAIGANDNQRSFRFSITPSDVVEAIKKTCNESSQSELLNSTLFPSNLTKDNSSILKYAREILSRTQIIGQDTFLGQVRQNVIDQKIAEAVQRAALEQAATYINFRLLRPDLTP